MTKIFLDSNIWLRYFLRDNDQFESVEKLLKLIDEGNFLPYCSSMVIMEVIFVLTRLYKKSVDEVIQCVDAILKIRNIVILEKTDIEVAIAYYKKLKIKFSDCLIASQIAKNMILVTFDQDFSKIKEIKIQTPQEVSC